jgi:peptidoglycan-N-acetylglucosamine deacetylase
MKHGMKLLAGLFAAAVFLAGGCAEESNPGKDAELGIDIDVELPPPDPKAGIEAFIEEHWQEYSYREKPTKYIALSFDDGPGSVTQNLLNALEAKKVKATFFLIGQNVRNNKAAAKAIFDKDHELGNHSDGYNSLGSSPMETITDSLTASSAAIKEITGNDPVLFRAPNVNYGDNLTRVCTEMGVAIIGVSVWSNDWQGIETQAIIANVVDNSFLNSGDGGIINCHELANTAAAVPGMIDGLRDKGFWIMTVGELAIVKEATLQPGRRYDSIK